MVNLPAFESKFPSEPLAIVGMACRLPGADDLDSFWDLMASGRSGIVEMPDDRMDRQLYFAEEQGQQSKTYSTISGLIPARPEDPSSDFRSIDVDRLLWDPCHEILCNVVEEARRDAGWTSDHFSASRTGVYVGHSCGSSLAGEVVLGSMMPEVADALSALPSLRDLSETERHEILTDVVAQIQHRRPVRKKDQPRLEAHVAAQLIARRFQLEGPQMVIDAACASSLVALALASAALTEGEIDQAVVSSASYAKTDSLILFSQARSCSAAGSRPFDAQADGLVNAEGYVVILLKTLANARFDGDKIHAVIRGIGLSSDGRGRSLWAPRKEGQLEAVRRAYGGMITRESVQYVEAHATSTQVGDATELDALATFFRDPHDHRKIPLGSVKSNIGHTLESAGLASLVKSVLCMQRGLIPPTINLSELNPTIDWKEHPFAPVTELVPWPDQEGKPRRAAVNAFGIGGLNAHVVVDGPPVESRRNSHQNRPFTVPNARRAPRTGHRPIDESKSLAIIGRGLVIPGANDLTAFTELLRSGESQLIPPPSDRWRDTPYSQTRPTIQQDYFRAKGGYIVGYQYDWRRHHIPPLQIENANPLQFLLLDATQQALDESGYGVRPFNQSRAAVIVGTLFGGDFSHQLQVGLRIPAIRNEFTKALKSRQWNDRQIQRLCDEAESLILKKYPAIKDQTGSFTCSTQASRIAKTLNVMGGAMAIDGGDCSSYAALQSAQHLLNSGIVDFVFCAAAQRDLDACAFEAWSSRSSESDLIPGKKSNDSPTFPGEGVVVLMLRRMKDAIEANDQIHGIIRDVHATKNQRTLSKVSQEPHQNELNQPAQNGIVLSTDSSRLIQQFGHLQGASGLLEIIHQTVRGDVTQNVSTINSVSGPVSIRTATELCEFHAIVDTRSSVKKSQPLPFENSKMMASESPQMPEKIQNGLPPSKKPFKPEMNHSNDHASGPSEAIRLPNSRLSTRIVRVWGVDENEIRQKLDALTFPTDGLENEISELEFPIHAPFRLAIVTNANDFRSKQQLSREQLQQGCSSIRAQENGIYFRGPSEISRPNWAVMFPGQGSQRSGMMSDVIRSTRSSAQTLAEADRALIRLNLPPCSDWIFDVDSTNENNLRSTQISMLTANVCAFEAIKEWGLQPDYTIGHSFGEYAALVSTGTLLLESAIAITVARARAVAACDHGRGAMLSIAATFREVQHLIGDQSEIFISHRNAPRQTVVAGTMNGIKQLAEKVKALGIPAIQVPVDSPFHTPLLKAAQPDLRVSLSQHRWRSPRIPLLSTVSGRFVADRDEFIENLTQQLIQPLNWVSSIERLLAEDVKFFLEVGPGRVLSKLTQQIIGDREAVAIAIDEPSFSIEERQLRIRAVMDVMGIPSTFKLKSSVSDQIVIPRETPSRLTKVAVDASAGHSNEAIQEVQSTTLPLVETSIVSNTPEVLVTEIRCLESSSNEDELSKFLIDVIVEQTGYPRDVIEFDWDLEADLGIDSIRKAMILGELREFFDFPSDLGQNLFNELRTLRDILALLQRSHGKGDWLQRTDAFGKSSIQSEAGHDSQIVPLHDLSIKGANRESELEDFLIDFIVERTGYPRDVVELDADLESDLGIDSIAKAQLIGEVHEYFHVPMDESATRSTFLEMRTLRQICDSISTGDRKKSTTDKPLIQAQTHRIERHHDSQVAGFSINTRSRNGSSLESQVLDSTPSSGTVSHDSEWQSAFKRGQAWGEQNRIELQNRLFDLVDQIALRHDFSNGDQASHDHELDPREDAELQGIAAGANVHPLNRFSIREFLKLPRNSDDKETIFQFGDGVSRDSQTNAVNNQEPTKLTKRFRLEMSPPEVRNWSGNPPEFAGGAIVIGNHAEAEELVRRLQKFGVTVSWLREIGDKNEAISALESIWKTDPSPHLFLMSPRDVSASTTLDQDQWKFRRQSGMTSVYWFCQRWMGLLAESNLMDDASLFGVTALGGDFGISSQIASAESGAITGLLKAIVIESWVNGHRTMPIKLIDVPTPASPKDVVNSILVELTEPSYDVEIGWNGNLRSVLRSLPDPLPLVLKDRFTPFGNWVVTGGARGITAYLVKRMGENFAGIHFHLVGTAPKPALTDRERHLARTDLSALRTETMQRAKADSRSPLKAWQMLEKDIEIDRRLTEFQQAGINASYHTCDVANQSELANILEKIRSHGPIAGVIHGAGIGKDASFQQKDPAMVERCLAAKIDGILNLMTLTQTDPLQAFIASGSISGRFGANGHTDYSMANDMLAKLATWHRQMRPDVPTTVFHWHAWDDIGMATKPETRLALEMIGMKLMPASEGAEHFLQEIQAGLPLSEVVITDDRYYRMFYPADRMLSTPEPSTGTGQNKSKWPLIRSSKSSHDETTISDAILNPVTDPFLIEHRLKDRPLLPMVIMVELMAEAASATRDNQFPKILRNLHISTSMKFPTEAPCEVEVHSRRTNSTLSEVELKSDFRSRNGKLVSPGRLYAKATFDFDQSTPTSILDEELPLAEIQKLDWKRAEYPSSTSEFFVGGPLRCLRKFAIDLENERIWGRISAPSLSELAGPHRDVLNWLTPSAVLDATLFTSGILAWCIRPGVALPQSAKQISFFRCPRPAEVCWVRSQIIAVDKTSIQFNITVWDQAQRPLFIIQDYTAGWLPE